MKIVLAAAAVVAFSASAAMACPAKVSASADKQLTVASISTGQMTPRAPVDRTTTATVEEKAE